MRRWLAPKLQLSLGLVSLVVSLIFIAAALGLLPDEDKAEIRQRGIASTALAVQLAVLTSHNDLAALKETIDAVVSRNSNILSIAIRDANGKILAGSEQHATYWREPPDGKSTPTDIQVPLLNDQTPAGRIELAFRPLSSGERPFGLGGTLFAFVGFMAAAAFAGCYLVLGRALRELDPSRTIPERVEAAFDTLAEGVLIVDDHERVVLVNRAFSQKILKNADLKIGFLASELPWLSSAAVPSTAAPLAPQDLPWRAALQSQRPVLGAEMSICDARGQLHRLVVNATCIVDGGGAPRGTIATFNDVTALHETNERLSTSIEHLRRAQHHVSEQNRRLEYLASRDHLTGCLNRRTFFEQAAALLADAAGRGCPFAFMMIDADHFKTVNDRYGHSVGDRVLVGLSDHLKRFCRPPHLVGRYGGEEFCIALIGLRGAALETMAEHIRHSVAGIRTWLPDGEGVTISIGIAVAEHACGELVHLASHADKALYAAKTAGRNRFVLYAVEAGLNPDRHEPAVVGSVAAPSIKAVAS